MVTHPTTDLPIWCSCMAERTGCPVLTSLWSYVKCYSRVRAHNHNPNCETFGKFEINQRSRHEFCFRSHGKSDQEATGLLTVVRRVPRLILPPFATGKRRVQPFVEGKLAYMRMGYCGYRVSICRHVCIIYHYFPPPMQSVWLRKRPRNIPKHHVVCSLCRLAGITYPISAVHLSHATEVELPRHLRSALWLIHDSSRLPSEILCGGCSASGV